MGSLRGGRRGAVDTGEDHTDGADSVGDQGVLGRLAVVEDRE